MLNWAVRLTPLKARMMCQADTPLAAMRDTAALLPPVDAVFLRLLATNQTQETGAVG